MVITIHDLDTPADLIAAIAAISQTANEHGDSFYQADWTFSHTPPPVPTVEQVTDIVQFDLTDYAALTTPARPPDEDGHRAAAAAPPRRRLAAARTPALRPLPQRRPTRTPHRLLDVLDRPPPQRRTAVTDRPPSPLLTAVVATYLYVATPIAFVLVPIM